MTTMFILRGLPGSGKSTLAKSLVGEDPRRRVRINVDGLRLMGHDGAVIPADGDDMGTEPIIQAGRDALVRAWLGLGYDVVVDEIALKPETIHHLLALGRECGAKVEIWDLTDVPLQVCLDRNAARPEAERVPEDRIIGRWEQYIEGKPYPLPLPDHSGGSGR